MEWSAQHIVHFSDDRRMRASRIEGSNRHRFLIFEFYDINHHCIILNSFDGFSNEFQVFRDHFKTCSKADNFIINENALENLNQFICNTV